VKTHGVVLLHLLMMAVMLFFIISMTMRLYFSRRMLEAKAEEATRERHLAQGAQAQILSCLYDSLYPDPGSCVPNPSQNACLASSFSGLPLKATLSGSPPACVLHVTINP
jgi:hypothetical protein